MGLNIIQQCIFILMLTQGFCSAEIRLDQSPAVVKRPGETVKISCKINGYSMTSNDIHWIRQKPGKALEWIGWMSTGNNKATYAESVKNQLIFTEDVPASTQYLEAKSLRTEDTAVYYCARKGYGVFFDYWGKGTTVTVTTAVQSPPNVPFPVSQCGSPTGGLVTLGCISRDLAIADGVSYKWTDESGTALTDIVQYPAVQGDNKYTVVSQVRVKASDWDNRKKFMCTVNNGKGENRAEVQKRVVPEYSASLLLTVPTQKELANGTATFICLAEQFSPKTYEFTWTQGDKNLNKNAEDSLVSEIKANYTAISVLKLNPTEWTGSSAPITCTFKQTKVTVSQDAQYEAGYTKQPEIVITHPSTTDILINRVAALTCKTEKDENFISINWYDANDQMIAPDSEIIDGSTIRLMIRINFTEWHNGTKFSCKVENSAFPELTKTEVYIRGNGQTGTTPTVYLLSPPENSGDSVTLTCYVKGFYPKEVAVSWLAGDKQVGKSDDYEHSTTEVIEKNKLFSVYSQLTFKKIVWESGTVFTCRVYHESIEDPVRHISRSISYVSDPPTLVNLNLAIPSTCTKC